MKLTVILLLQTVTANQRQNWRNWKQASATQSVKPRSYHGKNDYRWEIAGWLTKVSGQKYTLEHTYIS